MINSIIITKYLEITRVVDVGTVVGLAVWFDGIILDRSAVGVTILFD